MSSLKIVVEEHADGFVAYPLGMKGVVVGQGDSYAEAVADVTSAIRFHLETFGEESFEREYLAINAYVDDAVIDV